MPHDIFIGDVYIPPLLVAAVLALVTASLTNRVMVSRGLMAHFANPPLVYISLVVIFTVLFSSTLLRT